jgi:hypothetical protein
MTMYVDYGIESGSFDRANVRAVDTATGVKTLLTPTGATYNTNGNSRLLCDGIGNTKGWSGAFTTWRQATFDLSAFAGREIRLDARYSTDSSVLGSQGFWMDAVQIANATQIDCDAQPNVCAALPAESLTRRGAGSVHDRQVGGPTSRWAFRSRWGPRPTRSTRGRSCT